MGNMGRTLPQSEVEIKVIKFCEERNYSYEPFVYENMRVRNIVINCNICGYKSKPKSLSDIKRGKGCRKCAGTLKYTQDEAEAIVIKYCVDNNCTYEPFVYKNSRVSNIFITCNICGYSVPKTLSDIKIGFGCAKCAGNIKYTQDEAEAIVIEYCKEKNYTYEPFEYVGSHTNNIFITCNTCGYTGKPKTLSNIISGSGCKKCAGTLKHTQSEIEVIVSNFCKEKNHIYKPFVYKNNRTPIVLKCNVCGVESPKTLDKIIIGLGCKHCYLKSLYIPKELLDKKEKFILAVNRFTKQSKKVINLEWDGTDYIDGEYIRDYFELDMYHPNHPELDHKLSKKYCFDNDISAEVCGGVDNLGYTKKLHNSSKNKRSVEEYREWLLEQKNKSCQKF